MELRSGQQDAAAGRTEVSPEVVQQMEVATKDANTQGVDAASGSARASPPVESRRLALEPGSSNACFERCTGLAASCLARSDAHPSVENEDASVQDAASRDIVFSGYEKATAVTWEGPTVESPEGLQYSGLVRAKKSLRNTDDTNQSHQATTDFVFGSLIRNPTLANRAPDDSPQHKRIKVPIGASRRLRRFSSPSNHSTLPPTENDPYCETIHRRSRIHSCSAYHGEDDCEVLSMPTELTAYRERQRSSRASINSLGSQRGRSPFVPEEDRHSFPSMPRSRRHSSDPKSAEDSPSSAHSTISRPSSCMVSIAEDDAGGGDAKNGSPTPEINLASPSSEPQPPTPSSPSSKSSQNRASARPTRRRNSILKAVDCLLNRFKITASVGNEASFD